MPDNVDTVSLSSIMTTVVVAGTCAVMTKNPRLARATALAHLLRQGHVDVNTAFKCTAFFMGAKIEGISWCRPNKDTLLNKDTLFGSSNVPP